MQTYVSKHMLWIRLTIKKSKIKNRYILDTFKNFLETGAKFALLLFLQCPKKHRLGLSIPYCIFVPNHVFQSQSPLKGTLSENSYFDY